MWLVFWALILIAKFVLAGAYEDKTEVYVEQIYYFFLICIVLA